MFFDMPLNELYKYKPKREETPDFDEFWQKTLEAAGGFSLSESFKKVDYGLNRIETYDVSFNGYGGQIIKAWLLLPPSRQPVLPCVVEYIGYGGGRGFPFDWLLWSSVGYAHFIMDTRGQGSAWLKGDTPDFDPEGSSPQYPGFMTKGILDPKTYYYRRLITDAARAVEVVLSHPRIDSQKIAVTGHSQGGGLSIAVGGLVDSVSAVMPDAPFLCHYRRALEIVDTAPYVEISKYLQIHRDKVNDVFTTLSYFDGINFAARSKVDSLFSAGLMDTVCPPSTVFAAYNHYIGAKDIKIWDYNNHDAGGSHQKIEQVKFLSDLWS